MIRINVKQGTPEWHKHRANTFNASDAPAMMGVSKYKTRDQLLHEMAFGDVQEVDVMTQRRFDDGHRFEALARPLAEMRIGDDLYPVTGINHCCDLAMPLGASFDGLPMDETTPFEHKSLNDDLRKLTCAADLHLQYRIQMEQQLIVCEGERCLFMASKWNDQDECIESRECWYESDPDLRKKIILGWLQFSDDLEKLKGSGPVIEGSAKVVAEVMDAIPALFIQAKGEITVSNLKEFEEQSNAYIAKINTTLATDQDFANADLAGKNCRDAVTKIASIKEGMLAQTMTIGQAIATMDKISEKYRLKALEVEKLVKAEKENRRVAILQKARLDYANIVAGLEAEIKPVRLNVAEPDFIAAMKGKSTIKGLQGAANDLLAKATIAANAAAADMRLKLDWCKETSEGYGFLFPDLAELMKKPMDDFQLVINTKIRDHKEAEAKKEAEAREAIRKEEEAKATAKAEAEAKEKVAAEVKRQMEEQAKARLEAEALAKSQSKEEIKPAAPVATPAAPAKVFSSGGRGKKGPKIEPPSRASMLSKLAEAYGFPVEQIEIWLIAEFGGK